MSTAFHPLTITAIVHETADALSVVLDTPAASVADFSFQPGQHLTLRAQIAGEEVRRNYSICMAPQEAKLKIAIKRISGGLFSTWAMETLKVGDILEAMPPHGSFTTRFDPARRAHYAGFAGGSGITPVLSLLKCALMSEPQSRFTLFYGNRDSDSIIFLEELEQLKNRYMERLQIFHFLSHEEQDLALFNGVLDEAKCNEILDHLIAATEVEDYFICGPGPMMDAAESALRARGVLPAHIRIERFTVGRPSQDALHAIAAKTQLAAGIPLKVTLDGRTRIINFDADSGNILDSARASGLPAPYACKAGVCATCRAKVVSGSVTMAARYGLTDEEIAAGYVLTCQSIPDGDGVILDYDV